MKDYAPGAVIYFKFTTRRPSTGASHALASGAVSVYKDNSTTQSTAGVTLTADFDSLTGCNHVAIDTSADGTFYSSGSEFQLILTGGTVDSISVVGQVVGEFSLGKAVTLPTIPADWIAASGIAASAVTKIQNGLATAAGLSSLGAELPDSVADAVMEDVLTDHTTPGTAGHGLGVLVSTIGTTGAGLTAIPWNAAWDAEVQSECADALNAYDGPTKAEQDAAFTEIKGTGWSSTTDTLAKIKIDTAVARAAGVVTIGIISNAGTAVESYTYGGQTVTFAGLDTSGNRSGVAVS